MTIIVKIDENEPFIVNSDSELETAVLYTKWKYIQMLDLDEICEEEKK